MKNESDGQGLLVIGETLIDIVEQADGTRTSHVGGSPANVAVGLARLGQQVELLTSIGNDSYGDWISERLGENNVSVVEGSRHGRPTSTAVAVLDANGIADYTFDIGWELGPTGSIIFFL